MKSRTIEHFGKMALIGLLGLPLSGCEQMTPEAKAKMVLETRAATAKVCRKAHPNNAPLYELAERKAREEGSLSYVPSLGIKGAEANSPDGRIMVSVDLNGCGVSSIAGVGPGRDICKDLDGDGKWESVVPSVSNFWGQADQHQDSQAVCDARVKAVLVNR